MKLSVSVPDDLWERAQYVTNSTSPSVIVQKALNLMVGEQDEDIADIMAEHPFMMLEEVK